MFCIVASVAGLSSLQAQSLRGNTTPTEFPPSSFKGKQYIDSKGCIFIRAGIDGNVTWVPRVSRSRKLVCGYKPSLTAAVAARAPKTKPAVAAAVRITVAPAATGAVTETRRPAVAAARTAAKATTAMPAAVAKPKPKKRMVARPSPVAKPAAPVRVRRAVRTPKPAPRAAVKTRAPAAQTTGTSRRSGACANASAFSQQFINDNSRFPVRCGPQTEAPVKLRKSRRSSQALVPTFPSASSYASAQDTRIVQRHIYEQRQNTTDVRVAQGFQPVWQDDRLNPYRAERTTRPAIIRPTSRAPSGFKSAWSDDRLSTSRAGKTAAGEARTDRIWTRKLPRELVEVPLSGNRRIVVLSSRNEAGTVTRTSTRSAPLPKATRITQAHPAGKPRYVRVGVYASDASARKAAQQLARRGVSTRLGTVTRSGRAYRVVMAGPFNSSSQATAALNTVRSAGFSKARISR